MIRTLVWPSGPGLNSSREHCVVFLGKTLKSHGTSPLLGVKMNTSNDVGVKPCNRLAFIQKF